jgi:hypothetical protein
MNYFVRLHKDSQFFHLFPKGFVPVKQVPVPNTWTTRGTLVTTFVTTALCGDARQPEPVLWLDWLRCTPSQREWLSISVTALRGGRPGEFISYMDRGGDMPIRVSQTVDAPFPL